MASEAIPLSSRSTPMYNLAMGVIHRRMAKGRHREAQRVVLPNGMWLLLYADGVVKLAGYDRRAEVTEVLNRANGAHVFARIEPTSDHPRAVSPRADDLVTIERSVR